MKTILALVLAIPMAMSLAGCAASQKYGYFYVASTSEGYKVASDDNDLPVSTRFYTKGVTVEEAKRIADKLNASIPKEELARVGN